MSKLIRTKSLTLKVVMLFLAAVVVALILSFITTVFIEREIGMRELKKSIESSTETLSISLSYPLWSVDREQVKKLLTAEMLDASISAIMVKTNNQRDSYYIARSGDSIVFFHNDDAQLIANIRKSNFSSEKEIVFDTDTAGYVKVYSSNEYIQKRIINNTERILIQFSILIPLVILVLFYAFQKMIISPIINLKSSVASYTETKFSIRPKVRSEDEIGELAVKFNQMADTIEHDMTQIRQAQENITLLNKELEQRVVERTAELEIAKVHAEESDRMKSAFLATMSHELRTPLNSIIGFSGILLQGLAGPLNEEQKKQLGMVYASSDHLLSLINDVLDISKIEAGELELADEIFDVRVSLEKAASIVRPQAAMKGLSIELEIEADVTTLHQDKRRFEQVLLNLLSNAVKFSDGGSVIISCVKNGDTIMVSVKDTGIGIKKENIAELFKPFRQISTGLTRKYEGTGLGLSICAKLVMMMGGSIHVESEWGKGSTFMCNIPLKRRTL